MLIRRVFVFFCCSIISTFAIGADPSVNSIANAKPRPLFDFSSRDLLSEWRIVNDGVMGGRSSSKVRMGNSGEMLFSGNLSLENNGGFASTRSREKNLKLRTGDVIVMQLMGDGRRYTFNAYVPRRRMAFSFRTEFQTIKDEWTEVSIPIEKLVATSFGRVVRGISLNPTEVNSIGILLGDKKPGPFQLAIRSIEVVRGTN